MPATAHMCVLPVPPSACILPVLTATCKDVQQSAWCSWHFMAMLLMVGCAGCTKHPLQQLPVVLHMLYCTAELQHEQQLLDCLPVQYRS